VGPLNFRDWKPFDKDIRLPQPDNLIFAPSLSFLVLIQQQIQLLVINLG
jgi:hypothetical protein